MLHQVIPPFEVVDADSIVSMVLVLRRGLGCMATVFVPEAQYSWLAACGPAACGLNF